MKDPHYYPRSTSNAEHIARIVTPPNTLRFNPPSMEVPEKVDSLITVDICEAENSFCFDDFFKEDDGIFYDDQKEELNLNEWSGWLPTDEITCEVKEGENE